LTARAYRDRQQVFERYEVKREDQVRAEWRIAPAEQQLKEQRHRNHAGAEADGIDRLNAQVESRGEVRPVHGARGELC
jgi:hypothetical protein